MNGKRIFYDVGELVAIISKLDPKLEVCVVLDSYLLEVDDILNDDGSHDIVSDVVDERAEGVLDEVVVDETENKVYLLGGAP